MVSLDSTQMRSGTYEVLQATMVSVVPKMVEQSVLHSVVFARFAAIRPW